ncbi:MAG: DUF4296 domain-containing protein [Bacteroides sp.]|nr:DUF4296 domain-containing protein [Bacteroides sp.]
MRRLLPIITLTLILLVSCSKTPGYVISENKMAEIMADIHTAEAVVDANNSTFRQDSAKQAFIQSICMRHGVTTQELDTSLYWYGHNLQEYMNVYDKTIKILEDRIAEAEKAGGKSTEKMRTISIDGDSVNLWQGPSAIRNSGNNPTDFLTFTFNHDRNWEHGDRYTVSVKPINPRSAVSMTIVVAYDDGTIEYVTRTEGSEGMKRLTLVIDSAKTATNVYGNIHYAPSKGEISYLDSISVVRTRGRNDNVEARRGQQTMSLR